LSQSDFGETKFAYTSGKVSQLGDPETASYSPVEKRTMTKAPSKIGINSSMYCEVERIEKFKELFEKMIKEKNLH
jgi:pentatricopeptide repeat protein